MSNLQAQTENIELHNPDMYLGSITASLTPGLPLKATNADEKIPSGFETNAGSFRGGRNRKQADDADPASPNASAREGVKSDFRRAYEQKKAEAGKKPQYVAPEVPTPERLEKGDRPKKTKGGFYRAPPPIERIRDRNGLDANPNVARAMCEAASQLYQNFYQSGLNGVAAQDLSREIRGGGTTSSSFPRTERALHHRQRFRDACNAMGWFPDFPHRGAGRIVVDVCCYQMGVEDAAKLNIGKGRLELVRSNGIDRLREGLFALARHWRLI